MGSALASRSQDTQNLEAGASGGALADLIARRGCVHVRIEPAVENAEWDGVITSGTDEHLSLELVTPTANECTVRVSDRLRVVFETDRTCYSFAAPCIGVESGVEFILVRVERPKDVAKVERRRSPRRGLREPIRVRIQSERAAHALNEWASLLNLSADGLACRISSHAAVVAIDDVLCVSFELDHAEARFDLRARVINVTRGASVDHTILGVEFVPDSMFQADRDRLVVALAATGPK